MFYTLEDIYLTFAIYLIEIAVLVTDRLILMRSKFTMSEANSCGCSRSPTGKCVGWHNLTEEQYAEKKAIWEAKQEAKKAS